MKVLASTLACAAMLAACDAGPEQDCTRIHDVLRVRDASTFQKLRELKIGDPTIADAVKGVVAVNTSLTRTALDTPDSDPSSEMARLLKLCPNVNR